MRKLSLTILFLFTFTFLLFTSSFSQIPHLINYQGKLTDTSGNPVPDGTHSLAFRIYDAESGGNLLWQETQNLLISKGIFSCLLGGVTELNLPFDKPYWLAVKVGSDSEMVPRQQIASVGYALRSERADRAAVADLAESANTAVTAQKIMGKTVDVPGEQDDGKPLVYDHDNSRFKPVALPDKNTSNVIFSWIGCETASPDEYGITSTGVDDTPESGAGVQIAWVKGPTWRTLFRFRFVKIAGISKLTIHARLDQSSYEGYCKLDVNGITTTITIPAEGEWGWMSKSIDVSGLTDGEVYEGTISFKSWQSGFYPLWCSGIIIIAN